MRLVVAVIVCVAVGTAIVLVPSGDSGQNRNVQQQKEAGDMTPTVDFNTPEPPDPREVEIRSRRGRKYKSRIPLDKMEDQAVVFEIPSSHSPIEPAFPVGRSDVIVIGTITHAKAFISDDKSAVYSEFQVTVDQIIKNRSDQPVAEQSTLVAERIGGNVRFASGRVQRRGESGRNLPQKGKQYVLFLKWDELGKDYIILTGYEVRRDVVFPLDGLEDDNPRIYSNYSRYKNASFLEFISELQEVIVSSSHGEIRQKG